MTDSGNGRTRSRNGKANPMKSQPDEARARTALPLAALERLAERK